MKNTKRNLITSLITLLVCFIMLVGTTFAWFTDTVSNTGNKIQAGTLEIALEQYKKVSSEAEPSWIDISGDTNPVFASGEGNNALWEPGYSQYAVLRVTNKGNLALKYKILLTVNGTLELNENGHSIADAIDVYGFVAQNEDAAKAAYGMTSFADFSALEGVNNLGSLSAFLFDEDGAVYGSLLPVGSTVTEGTTDVVGSAYAVLCLHMKEEAGNEYQSMSLGTSFDIVVNATQYSYEKDGLNSKDYDSLANGNPDHPEFDVKSAPITKVVKILPVNVESATEGTKATVKTETPVETEGMKVTYPVGTVISDTTLPTSTETTDAIQGFEYMSDKLPTDSTIKVQDSKKVANYELTLPVSEDNQVLVAVEKFVGVGLPNLELYHGNEKLANAPSGNDEYFIYNSVSGIVTIYVKHASPIVFVYGQNVFHVYTSAEQGNIHSEQSGGNNTYLIIKAEDNETIIKDVNDKYPLWCLFTNSYSGLDPRAKLVNDGDIVYIHEGEYNADTCVYIYDSVSIIGVGDVKIRKSSVVSDSNKHLIDIKGDNVSKTVNVYLENLTLDVGHYNAIKNSNDQAQNCLISFNAYVYAKNVIFKNATGGGVDLNCTNETVAGKKDLTTQITLEKCLFSGNWDWKTEDSGITDIKIDINKEKAPNATACVKLIDTNLESKMFIDYNGKGEDKTVWKVYNNGTDISSQFGPVDNGKAIYYANK